jgi:hypothetical protein
MKVEGACHCGDITFTADVDPESARICHCTDCQTLSGSAFRMVVITRPGTFELRSGAPTTYVKTTAESGTPREHGFCPRCGTPIYATSIGPEPKAYGLRTGAIRQRLELSPKLQIWSRSRAGWLDGLHAMTSLEKDR